MEFFIVGFVLVSINVNVQLSISHLTSQLSAGLLVPRPFLQPQPLNPMVRDLV